MSMQSLLAATAKATARQLPGVAVVYRLFEDSTFVPSTGGQVITYHDVSIRNVMKDMASVRDVAAAQGVLQLGDSRLVFPVSDLADHVSFAKAKAVSTSDLIVQGMTQFRVVAFDTFGNDTMYRIFARRQG